MYVLRIHYLFFFQQKTGYEMRISDWSSDVCSSDLRRTLRHSGDRRAGSRCASAAAGKASPARPSGAVPSQPRCCAAARWKARRTPSSETPFCRSAERRAGKECVSTLRSRGSPYNENKKKIEKGKGIRSRVEL